MSNHARARCYSAHSQWPETFLFFELGKLAGTHDDEMGDDEKNPRPAQPSRDTREFRWTDWKGDWWVYKFGEGRWFPEVDSPLPTVQPTNKPSVSHDKKNLRAAHDPMHPSEFQWIDWNGDPWVYKFKDGRWFAEVDSPLSPVQPTNKPSVSHDKKNLRSAHDSIGPVFRWTDWKGDPWVYIFKEARWVRHLGSPYYKRPNTSRKSQRDPAVQPTNELAKREVKMQNKKLKQSQKDGSDSSTK